MNQIITSQKSQLKLENIYVEWTKVYGFMISSHKCWLPGDREKGLGDPNSPFSYSTSLTTGGTRVIHLVSDERQSVFLFMFSMVCFTSLMKGAVCQSEEREVTRT